MIDRLGIIAKRRRNAPTSLTLRELFCVERSETHATKPQFFTVPWGNPRESSIEPKGPIQPSLEHSSAGNDDSSADIHAAYNRARHPSATATATAVAGRFTRVVVITTTLISTSAVPRIVRAPSASPPKKYPTSTATTGFTYA
jgi:hypothetical protein